MNVDIYSKDFQTFVIHNMPVFLLETMVTMYQADLGIERALQIDSLSKPVPITERELKEFIKSLKDI